MGGKALDRSEYKWQFSSPPQKCILVSSTESERAEQSCTPLTLMSLSSDCLHSTLLHIDPVSLSTGTVVSQGRCCNTSHLVTGRIESFALAGSRGDIRLGKVRNQRETVSNRKLIEELDFKWTQSYKSKRFYGGNNRATDCHRLKNIHIVLVQTEGRESGIPVLQDRI